MAAELAGRFIGIGGGGGGVRGGEDGGGKDGAVAATVGLGAGGWTGVALEEEDADGAFAAGVGIAPAGVTCPGETGPFGGAGMVDEGARPAAVGATGFGRAAACLAAR